jgi:hypothetical protein
MGFIGRFRKDGYSKYWLEYKKISERMVFYSRNRYELSVGIENLD